jgi:hypothetical protein
MHRLSLDKHNPCFFLNAYLKKLKNEVEYGFNSWDQKLDHGYIEGY